MHGSKKEHERQEGILYRMFKNFYVPLVMQPAARATVIVAFLGWLCASLAVVPYVEVGLDREISMPEDSYMMKVFQVGEECARDVVGGEIVGGGGAVGDSVSGGWAAALTGGSGRRVVVGPQ